MFPLKQPDFIKSTQSTTANILPEIAKFIAITKVSENSVFKKGKAMIPSIIKDKKVIHLSNTDKKTACRIDTPAREVNPALVITPLTEERKKVFAK